MYADYVVGLKFLNWIFVIAFIFLQTLTVFQSLNKMFFILWHSLHIVFPILVVIIAPLYIPWLIGVCILIIFLDSTFLVMSIIEATRCTPILCPEGVLPWVWLAAVTFTFALVALITIGMVWKMSHLQQRPRRNAHGYQHPIGYESKL